LRLRILAVAVVLVAAILAWFDVLPQSYAASAALDFRSRIGLALAVEFKIGKGKMAMMPRHKVPPARVEMEISLHLSDSDRAETPVSSLWIVHTV
jgi:hypothetical protein